MENSTSNTYSLLCIYVHYVYVMKITAMPRPDGRVSILLKVNCWHIKMAVPRLSVPTLTCEV